MSVEDNLSATGVPYPLVRSIMLGLAGSTTAINLSSHGIPGPLAIELAKQVNAKSFRVADLAALGMPPAQALAIAALGSYPAIA